MKRKYVIGDSPVESYRPLTREGNQGQRTNATNTTREDSQGQPTNATNTTESMWHSIPAFLLWMIKDKLDIFDDMSLSVVCRDWWSSSASYPKKQCPGNKEPWLMQKNEGSVDSWDFICVATKKKFTMDLPEFHESKILYTREGWFLMKQECFDDEEKEAVVFMMNPFIEAKIKLPSVGPLRFPYSGTFSTREGYPHRVLLVGSNSSNVITIKMTYIGDELWTNHSYTESNRYTEFCRFLTIGEYVYCYDFNGDMLAYNMATRIWKEVPGSGMNGINVIEFEGHLIKVVEGDDLCQFFIFFKYNDVETSWEELNNDDIKESSWFLAKHGQGTENFCYCTRKKGLKVYDVCSNYDLDDFLGGVNEHINPARAWRLHYQQRHLLDLTGYSVVTYDLMDGRKEILDFPYRICSEARWVHI